MKKTIITSCIFAAIVALTVTGSAFTLGGKELVLNGGGNRTKFFINVYYCNLFVPAELKGKSAEAIMTADAPMSVILYIKTSKLTSEKFIDAIREGFQKAKSAGYGTGKSEQFIGLFKGVKMNTGDVVYLNYVPGKGVMSSYKFAATKKTQFMGTVPGLDFKKALYAIWLGPDPVQSNLKDAMLGK